jgi:hypothetical protein
MGFMTRLFCASCGATSPTRGEDLLKIREFEYEYRFAEYEYEYEKESWRRG